MERRDEDGDRLLLIGRRTPAVEELVTSSDNRVFRFKKLPFVWVPSGHPATAEPPDGVVCAVSVSATSYGVAWAINRMLLETSHLRRTWAPNGNRWACGLAEHPPFYAPQPDHVVEPIALTAPTRLAHPAVLNLSLQLRPGPPFDDTALLSVATRVAARHLPVVVAAGNWGRPRRRPRNTMSPLAILPWVISVGATEDPQGTRLLSTSSTALPGEWGPSVVSYGQDPFAPERFGTSYAAPRVARQLNTIAAFLLQVRAVDELRTMGQIIGVPLVLSAWIDMGFEHFSPAQDTALPMLPHLLGLNEDGPSRAVELLARGYPAVRFDPTPKRVRTVLLSSARSVAGYGVHEVGHGFVDDDTTLDYLGAFTGADLARLVVDDASSLDASTTAELERLQIGDRAALADLAEVTQHTYLRYGIDLRDRKVHATMRDPAIIEGERGFWTDPPTDEPWPPAYRD